MLRLPVHEPVCPSAVVIKPTSRFRNEVVSPGGISLTLRSKQNSQGPIPAPHVLPSPQSTRTGGPGVGQVPLIPYANHPLGRMVPSGEPQQGPQQPPSTPPKSGQSYMKRLL